MRVYQYILFLCIIFLGITSIYSETITLKDGQTYNGTIIEEYPTVIKVTTDFGTVMLEREQIMSIVRDTIVDDGELNKTTDTVYPSDGGKSGAEKDYKKQIKYLTEQLKVYKREIESLEKELNELDAKYQKNENTLNVKIKDLKKQLSTKEKEIATDRFPELTPISPGQEIKINQGYIQKVKFRISKSYEGYFVGAEYTIYSKLIPVTPQFSVFFFNERGLNIGVDVINRKYASVVRGQPEVIVKGVPMSIASSEPKYFYIKILEKE